MFKQQTTSNILVVSFAVSLFLFVGCEKQKAVKKSQSKGKKTVLVKSDKTVKISNLIINPSVEEGEKFDSGIGIKNKAPKEKALGWTTGRQVLDDFSGWAVDESHSGKRSLKIENIGGSNAVWAGERIILKTPANSFKASIWTKAEGMKDKSGKCRLEFRLVIFFKGDTKKTENHVNIYIAPKDHDWKRSQRSISFDREIESILPRVYFLKGTGTVWIDDMSLETYKNDK